MRVAVLLGGLSPERPVSLSTGAGCVAACKRLGHEVAEIDPQNPDWQESLESNAFKTITTPTSTVTEGDDATYTPPTTLTGKFSEAFFKDYFTGKIKGKDFSDPTAGAQGKAGYRHKQASACGHGISPDPLVQSVMKPNFLNTHLMTSGTVMFWWM